MVLGFDSQSLKGWECHEGEKMWSIDACPYFYCVDSFPSSFFYHLVFFCSLVLSFFLTPLSVLLPSPLPHGYLSSLLYRLIL